MSDIIDALWAETAPDVDGDPRFWKVGGSIWNGSGYGGPITRITVQKDEPGLHCDMRRVCVWIGETMVVEVPAHMTMIGYPLPEDDGEATQ